MGHKVRVRKKPIKDSRHTLYLEFYPAIPHPEKAGATMRKKYLKLYVLDKPRTPLDKQHTKETLLLAEQIRQKWEAELNKPEIYTEYEKEQLRKQELQDGSFLQYFELLTKGKKESTRKAWESCLYYLQSFCKGKGLQELAFKDLTERLCMEFREYLLTVPSRKSPLIALSQNSAHSYFNKFKAALREAYKEECLGRDLNALVKAIPQEETNREYLTPQELEAMAKTKCQDPLLKRAGIFSALTGLRYSDVRKLTWSEIQEIQGSHYIVFRQQKTKGLEYLPLPKQALLLIGEGTGRQEKDLVFDGLRSNTSYIVRYLERWVRDAGINKQITFHSFRHTFAVHQLFQGTDIYTVSKLLGHKDLKTTQIYAKIVDSMKREAMDKATLDIDLSDFE